MELIILGSGSAIHDTKRISTSSLVVTEQGKFLVDCGPGTSHRLAQAGYRASDVQSIFITHLHQDHCLELATLVHLRVLFGDLSTPRIYGPVGIEKYCSVFFHDLYPYIPHSVEKRGERFDLHIQEMTSGEIFEEGDMKVSWITVKHPIPTLGYRFDTSEGSIGFSGDTEPYEPLADFCKDVDVLVHECFWPDRFGPVELHTIPSELGPIAAQSGAKHLVLNHLNPKVNGYEQEMVDSIAQNFSGKITVAEDLMRIPIPK